MRTVVDESRPRSRPTGRSPVRTEGVREQQWTLIDYGDVVVHVFLESVREFYEIERLYMDVPTVEWDPTRRLDRLNTRRHRCDGGTGPVTYPVPLGL